MKKNIPTYYASVDEDGTGMYVVSLVDEPAVEVGWQLFNSVQEMFKIEDADRQIITGVVMLAETPIYRRDRENGEYYITHPISVSDRFCKAISLPVSHQLLPRDLVASFGIPTKGVFEVAILHDVLEDTEVTLEDIRGIYKEYGDKKEFISNF